MSLFSLKNIGRNCFLLLLTLTLMVIWGGDVKGQTQTYADSQTNGVTGICIGCGVTNAANPINPSNLTDYSNFVVTVGLLGVSVQQTLIFPAVNPNIGCDEIVIRIGSGATLLTANLLGGVTVQTYNGATANSDAVTVNSSILTLLGTDNQGEIRFKPSANFDRVRLTLSSALIGALANFRIYYAYSLTGKPIVAATAGTSPICVNASTTFTNATPEGVWSSGNTSIAIVNASGVVTGVSAGTAAINYTVTNASTGCSTVASRNITVNALPVVAVITGTVSACIGNTTQLASTTSGGVWTSGSTGIATVNGSGLVTGVAQGTSVITYTVTNGNGCVATQTATVTINPLPVVNAITGTLSACIGNTTQLASTTSGGVWTSGSTGIATVNSSGLVTGVAQGTSVITYTVTNGNGCVASQTATVTINALPVVASITGTLSACIGQSTQLSSTPSGGVWTSSATGIATVNSSGSVTGVAQGTSLITYTVTNGNNCVAFKTATVTINALPVVAAITGTMSTCIGKTTQLANATGSGVWSSGTSAVASVNSSGLVTGLTAGTATINYTVTNGNGCITMVSASVVIHLQPALPAINPKNLCLGQSVDLNTLNPNDGSGTTGGTYSWSAISAGGTALSSTTVSPALGNTTYYLRYTKDGCFSDSSVLIIMHPKPPTPHVILN